MTVAVRNRTCWTRAFDPNADATVERPSVGLAFTRAIVEQHGGRLDIRSEPGEGTYARLDLPLR